MCQGRLSKDASQKTRLRAVPPVARGRAPGTRAGSQLPACCLPPSPPPNLTRKSPPVSTPRKKARSANTGFYPAPPFLLGIHPRVPNAGGEPFVQPAARCPLPRPPARDAAEHGSRFTFPSLGLSSPPRRRAKSRLIASRVPSTPLTYRG